MLENAETCFGFTFCGAPTGKMEGLRERACQVIRELTNGERELELPRMHAIIKNQILNILNQVSGWRGVGVAGGECSYHPFAG